MTIFELTLLISGFPVKKAQKYFKKLQSLSISDFRNWQRDRMSEILNYHYRYTPFYRDFVGKNFTTNWEDLPILTKKDLRLPLDKLISSEYKSKDLRISSTSGSTGTPMLFAKDKFAHALTWTIIKNRYSWYGIKLSSNQARFYGIPLSKWKYLKERIKDYFMNRFRFVVFDLSDKNLKRFENKFRKRKFDFIYGYTNSMVVFAKYLINKNLILSKHVCPTLKSCIVTSEQCSELDQNILEKGFGVNVIKEYGASELDFIAFTNADGVWTISNELVYVEIIGDNGLPLPDGEVGKIVVTSLHNRAMPFIRYEIGDLGSIKHNVLKKHDQLLTLNGRLNDFAILPSGKRVPGFTLYYVSRQILEDTGLVKEYVIRQITKFDFVFEIVSERTISKKDEELIIKIMENYLEPGLNIVINKVEEINRDKSGKLKHFVSFVKE